MRRTKDDWTINPMPEKHDVFTLDRNFSPEQMERLRYGNIPQEMEDKWFWYKVINSKNIVSFDTTFYIEKNDFLVGGYSGFYHFTIKDNVLSEDAQLNLSGKIEQPVLDELQKIIEKYDLVKKNGIDCYTAGAAPEYAPCYFKAGYDSGEQLYFKEDNDPLAKWAEEVFELFRKAFSEMGYEQLKLFKEQTSETVTVVTR